MDKAEFIRRATACERRLYRVSHTMLRQEADCEDAVQEALLRAWAKLDTLRNEAFFETWLIRILINQCKQHYRKQLPVQVELTDTIPAMEEGTLPLLEALLSLPEKPRIALELHCIEGYSVKECARMLSVPEGTVKWRLSRGRALLKAALGEEAQA